MSTSVKAIPTTTTETTSIINNIKLDNGVLTKIMNNHSIEKPKLQVLNIRNINTSQNPNDRYLILLSDGEYFESACLLLPNLNSYVRTQKLKKDSIIQLDKYALNSIPNGKVLVIVELTIICSEYTKIGNPIALTQKKQQQPQQQQQQSSSLTTPPNKKQQKTTNSGNKEDIEEICKCSNCQDKNTILLCYKMLGLNENATKEEVRCRYIYLTNENNEKVHNDSKLAEKFDIMTKAYTLIMGMKNSETDEENDNNKKMNSNEEFDNEDEENRGGGDDDGDGDDDDDDDDNDSNASSSRSKIKIPLEDFLQYAWLKAADECSYATDSDSDCDVAVHRRKNRNPKAFYQQMKKSNKTLSIKAMKKRAKEVTSIQLNLNNNEPTSITTSSKMNSSSSVNGNIKQQQQAINKKMNDDKQNEMINSKIKEVSNKNQKMESSSIESSSIFSSSASTSSSSSEIKIAIKKDNDDSLRNFFINLRTGNNNTTNKQNINEQNCNNKQNIEQIQQQQQQEQQTKSSKKRRNKKKKNKKQQKNKIQLPSPPPPPPPPIMEHLISELKSSDNVKLIDEASTGSNQCNHQNEATNCEDKKNNNESYNRDDGTDVDEEEEDEDEEEDEEEEEEHQHETNNNNKSITTTITTNDVAVSTIAANIENLTSAFKDDTPENKNLREKLKNIVSSLQSLQKVIDTHDLKMYTKLTTTSKVSENDDNKSNSNDKSSNNTAHAVITANFISNIEKLMSTNPQATSSAAAQAASSLKDNRIKNATLELSSCELKKSHDSILSELIETRNEINNARNQKLLKHQQDYHQLTQNSELNSSIIDHLNKLKTITLSTCMSHIEDFKINYKLLANNHELVLDEEGKLAIKNHSNDSLNNIDNNIHTSLTSLASESVYKQIEATTTSEMERVHDQHHQQEQEQQKINKKKNKKKQKQQEKKDESISSTSSASNNRQSVPLIETNTKTVKSKPVVINESNKPVKIETNKKKKIQIKSQQSSLKPSQPSYVSGSNSFSSKLNEDEKEEEVEVEEAKTKGKSHKHSNLSDLDSFSLDSVSSSVTSLVSAATSSNIYERSENDNDEQLENERKKKMFSKADELKIIENINEEDDDGDWIQVKKPTRSNTTIFSKAPNPVVIENIKGNNLVKYASNDLNKKSSTFDSHFETNLKSSTAPSVTSSESSIKSVKLNKNEENKLKSANNKTELLDLVPKSIDEEEIMLKKALELSLKYSEDNKNVKEENSSNAATSVTSAKKFDCIDDFNTDFDLQTNVKKEIIKEQQQQPQQFSSSKQKSKTKQLSTSSTTTSVPPAIVIKSNKNSPNTKQDASNKIPQSLTIEQQKKVSTVSSNSSSYTNGMSYAAKSAMKLNEESSSSMARSSSKSSDLSKNLISVDEFPPVTVHKPPTLASLFQNNRINSPKATTNTIKIPTQTVAPLIQENFQSRSLSPIKKPGYMQQRPESIEPQKSIAYDAVDSLDDLIVNESPLAAGPLVTPPPPVTPTVQVSKNSIELIQQNEAIARKPISMPALAKKSSFFTDFRNNGKDLDIDSTNNAPNVDSPKKAVGAERPIGFKPNLPTAVVTPSLVAPTPIGKPIGSGLTSSQASQFIQPIHQHHQQIVSSSSSNDINSHKPQAVQYSKTTPSPPGLQSVSSLDNFQQQQKLFNPIISTPQFCELPANMNPQMLQMILNNNNNKIFQPNAQPNPLLNNNFHSTNSNSLLLNNVFNNNQQKPQYSNQMMLINQQSMKQHQDQQQHKIELNPIGSSRPSSVKLFPHQIHLQQPQQHQLGNRMNFNVQQTLQKFNSSNINNNNTINGSCLNTQGVVNEYYE